MTRRILLLVTDLEVGGTPTVVRELACRLHAPPEVEVEVACLAPPGPLSRQIEQRGLRTHALRARSVRDVGVLARLAATVRSGGFETLLSFLVHANAAAAAVRCVAPGPRFLQSIQTTQARPAWHWQAQRFAAMAADAVVVPTPSCAAAAARRSGIAVEKIHVIPNAIDAAALSDLRARPRRDPASAMRVGFLGRLDPVKRVPDLVRALALLDERFTLEIVGEGPQRDAIARAIDDAGVGRRCRLSGATASPRDALARMDALVLPSEAEGFGLVLIEAMAAGVTVIASDAPGIRDVVQDGVNGWLTPIGRPEAIAAALREIADGRRSITDDAIDATLARYAWPGVLRAYRRLLRLPD